MEAVIVRSFDTYLEAHLLPNFSYYWDLKYVYVNNYTFDPTDNDIDDLPISGHPNENVQLSQLNWTINGISSLSAIAMDAAAVFIEMTCSACGIVIHFNDIPLFYIEFPATLQCDGGFSYCESGNNYGQVARFSHQWDEDRSAQALQEWG